METLLINEQVVDQFKYWREGQIRIGMRFRSDLFEHISKFEHSQRHQAFDLAWRLGIAGKTVVVTASAEQYVVWAGLRDVQETNQVQTVVPPMFVRALEISIGERLLPQPALSA